MIEGNLEVYNLTLKTATPVFIGSGRTICKKEYCYDPVGKTMTFFNYDKFIDWIADSGLADKYEEFMMNPVRTNLYDFMKDNYSRLLDFIFKRNLNTFKDNEKAQYEKLCKNIVSYSIPAGSVFTGNVKEKRNESDIQEFIRHKGLPYIPGSSIKGALRTAILIELMRRGGTSYCNSYKMQYLASLASDAEVSLLHKNRDRTAVSSFMKGVSISDSRSLSLKNLILASKLDVTIMGKDNTPNVVRECLKPECTIKSKLVLDKAVLKGSGIDINLIRDAISNFEDYYNDFYIKKFNNLSMDMKPDLNESIIIGGGPGYFSKNIIYMLLGEKQGLGKVREHCLKYALYGNEKKQHFGICRVSIE